MQMTESEIKRNVLDAADQKAQVQICADLNETTKDEIKRILIRNGVDLRRLKGTVKKHLSESKPRKKRIESSEKKQLTPVEQAVAVIRAEIEEINRQQYQLDMRKADLYHTIWEMLGEVE